MRTKYFSDWKKISKSDYKPWNIWFHLHFALHHVFYQFFIKKCIADDGNLIFQKNLEKMFLKWNVSYVECFCLKWCHHYDFMVCRKVFSLVKTRKMIIVYSLTPPDESVEKLASLMNLLPTQFFLAWRRKKTWKQNRNC